MLDRRPPILLGAEFFSAFLIFLSILVLLYENIVGVLALSSAEWLKEVLFWLVLVLIFTCFGGQEVRPLVEKYLLDCGFWFLQSVFGWLQANWRGGLRVWLTLVGFSTIVHILLGNLSLVYLIGYELCVFVHFGDSEKL